MPPVNDDFANAINLSGSSPIVYYGNNYGATFESGEPAFYYGFNSVWWRFTPESTSQIRISLAGSSFDTVLAVFVGSTLSTLTRVVSNDDSAGTSTSAVQFTGYAGTTYHIQVAGFNEASVGIIRLTLTYERWSQLSVGDVADYDADAEWDITTAGLDLLLPNDDEELLVDLSFPVSVGSYTGNTIRLCNNGWIAFGPDTVSFDDTYNYTPIDLRRVSSPLFAGLWYDIDTRSPSSGICRYGELIVDGLNAFRAVWSNVGAYSYQEFYSTFAMTVYDTGDDSYWMESHVLVNDAYQWDTPPFYPSPSVVVGLTLGALGGGVVDQWFGRSETDPGLYTFRTGGGWGIST